MTSIHLNGHHRKALAGLFRHPASHNVEWHDVVSLLNHVGTVTERHDGALEVAIGADRITLKRPHGHDVQGEELRDLRAFLTKAGFSPESHPPLDAADEGGNRPCIVLIDHQHARLFGLRDDDVDQFAPRVLSPEDADGSRRKLEHRQGNDDHDGGHAEEEDAWYERIAIDLEPAHRIVVLSDGKGRSSAGAYLVDYCKRRHPALAARIVATERVDIAHLSDAEIVAAGIALLDAEPMNAQENG